MDTLYPGHPLNADLHITVRLHDYCPNVLVEDRAGALVQCPSYQPAGLSSDSGLDFPVRQQVQLFIIGQMTVITRDTGQ